MNFSWKLGGVIAALLIVAGLSAYVVKAITSRDKVIASLQGQIAAIRPDTIYVQGKVDTVKITKYVYRFDTITIDGKVKVDTIYRDSTTTADITVSGNASKVFRTGVVSAGCVAHYPSGKMDFTLGMYEYPEKTQYGLISALMIYRGRLGVLAGLSRTETRYGVFGGVLTDGLYCGGGAGLIIKF